MRLQQRQARETGICPVRRELYSQTFDELIRQITIECAERGLLLLRCVCVCVHVCMCVGASYLGMDDSSRPSLGVGDSSHPSLGVDDSSHPSLGVDDSSRPSLGVDDSSCPSL